VQCRKHPIGQDVIRQADAKYVVDPEAELRKREELHRKECCCGTGGTDEQGDKERQQKVVLHRHPDVCRNQVFTEVTVSHGVALHPPTDEATEVHAQRWHQRINSPRSSMEESTVSGLIVQAWMIRATDL